MYAQRKLKSACASAHSDQSLRCSHEVASLAIQNAPSEDSDQTVHMCEGIMKTCLFKYTENFTTKKWNFQIKNSNIFHISAQNIDCGYSLEVPRQGGSNEYPQSMFWTEKNNVYPCKSQFYWGLRGSKLSRRLFVMVRFLKLRPKWYRCCLSLLLNI